MSAIIVSATDVGRILGLPTDADRLPPPITDDEGIIIFWYGGWNLRQLAECEGGRRHMWPQKWYYDTPVTVPPAAHYKLRIFSEGRTKEQQKGAMVPEGLWMAPITLVVAAAILVAAEPSRFPDDTFQGTVRP